MRGHQNKKWFLHTSDHNSACKKNPTSFRSFLGPLNLDQSEASVAYVLANKRTVFDLEEGDCSIG